MVENSFAGYFISEDIVKRRLLKYDFAKLPITTFIDYSHYLDYYVKDIKKMHILCDDELRLLKIPYREEINFLNEPQAILNVELPIKEYNLPKNIGTLTQNNLKAFCLNRPNTFNDPILRMAAFRQVSNNKYICLLQIAKYFDMIRTNSTIDFELDENGMTLRKLDLNSEGCLKSIENSSLTNSVGVSAILYFSHKNKNYFFMKIRQANLNIFENMFGTTSGGMTIPQRETPFNLLDFAIEEINRECDLETGLDRESGLIEEIIPLSFTRELIRGGKPQFFFLIKIQNMSKINFEEKILSSEEGGKEFYLTTGSDISNMNVILSPEFVTNLLYAFQYFQVKNNIAIDPIII